MKEAKSVFKKNWMIWVNAFALVGCVSYQPGNHLGLSENDVNFPVGQCVGQEGGVRWKYVEDDRQLHGEAEWIVDQEGRWIFEVIDAWGQTHARLSSQENKIQVHPKSLVELKLADDFIVIDDNWVGIRSKEIPCILEGKIPQAWLQNMKLKTPDIAVFKDGKRKIKIRTKEKGWKINIKWPVFYGLWSQKVTWYLSKKDESKVILRGGDRQIVWKRN